MSGHLSVQTAIVAALTANPALASGNVLANTVRPMSAGVSAAVVVRIMHSDAVQPQVLGGPFDWRTLFQVECLARAATGASEPIAAVDALLASAWARLAGIAPGSNGVTDVRLDPAITWQVDDAETPLASAVISLRVSHLTDTTTLAAWP